MRVAASRWHAAVYTLTEDQSLRTLTAAKSPARNDSSPAPSEDESPALKEIHAWIKDQGLSAHLACLPEPTAYTVIKSTNPVQALKGKNMLFLGERGKNQAWARLKEFNMKGDEIEYLVVNLSTGAVDIERNIKNLAINLYPFDQAANKKTDETDTVRDGLSVLVRYVLRKTGHCTQGFNGTSLNTFRVVLNVIQKAVNDLGGGAKSSQHGKLIYTAK